MPKSVYMGFRMRQLPKAEYRLMKVLINKYQLDDPCELFTCLLRLTYEVSQMKPGTVDNGSDWLQAIIAGYRDLPHEERVYELE